MSKMGSTVADRYRLDSRLGAGGMSTVYLAFDSVLERNVAIKMLAEHLSEDEAFVARFKHEALAVAGLAHPNIVQVFDSGVDGHSHYIVMEYVDGRSVAQLLKQKGRFGLDEAVDIGIQSCAGLKYAHSKGVVHRDIKPGNLLIGSDGTLKIADFGIAKAAEQTRITQAGSVLGTAAYLAPEQAHGEEATPSSDIYSLGVVLYQLLAGRLPYEYSTLTELALKQQRESIPPLPSLSDDVPLGLGNAIATALARKAQDRYSDAQAFADALERGASGKYVDAPLDEGPSTAETAYITNGGDEERTRVVDRTAAKPAKTKKNAGRLFAAVVIFLLIAAAAAYAVIELSSTDRGRQIEQVVEDTVQDQIQGLKDLIRDNTQ